MENMSKFVQGFAVILFAITSITSFGISEEEKTIVECDRKLDIIQNIEASGNCKIRKILSHSTSPIVLGMAWGYMCYLIHSFFFNANDSTTTKLIPAILGGSAAAYAGNIFKTEARQYLEAIEKYKKDITITKETAIKALEAMKNK